MAQNQQTAHEGHSLAIGWCVQASLWMGISHFECSRMIAAKWPTVQGHHQHWPRPRRPFLAYHLSPTAELQWTSGSSRRRWAGSHSGAIHCINQQFQLGLSRFRDTLQIALVCKSFHRVCCQWIPSLPSATSTEPQGGDPNNTPLIPLPLPLPTTWPLRLTALRNHQEPRNLAHWLADMSEPMFL